MLRLWKQRPQQTLFSPKLLRQTMSVLHWRILGMWFGTHSRVLTFLLTRLFSFLLQPWFSSRPSCLLNSQCNDTHAKRQRASHDTDAHSCHVVSPFVIGSHVLHGAGKTEILTGLETCFTSLPIRDEGEVATSSGYCHLKWFLEVRRYRGLQIKKH